VTRAATVLTKNYREVVNQPPFRDEQPLVFNEFEGLIHNLSRLVSHRGVTQVVSLHRFQENILLDGLRISFYLHHLAELIRVDATGDAIAPEYRGY
jgi:hypothetical protein